MDEAALRLRIERLGRHIDEATTRVHESRHKRNPGPWQHCPTYTCRQARKVLADNIGGMSEVGQLPYRPHCPSCGEPQDGYAGSDRPPRHGDFSVCVYCGRLGVYDGLSIRKPNDVEAAQWECDPERPQVERLVTEVQKRRNAGMS